jgi:small subunit ribosomal protein S29
VEWLEYFRHMNEGSLKDFKINKEIYGKFNFSGLHDEDPEAVPDIYYSRRKAYFSEHKKF